MTGLQVTWFLLIGVLLTVYAILDGFDLGVGVWYLKAKGDTRRRALLRSIGPVWDGNEVWLLTGGGALFAAFPHVYATVFSGMYLALMLVLLGLIFRAVSIEFRDAEESPLWRSNWDIAFSVGSIIPALLFGVALGNILRGMPLDASMSFTGNFFTLLNPYALLIGVTGLAMLATHGAIYAAVKTHAPLTVQARNWARSAWYVFAAAFGLAMVVTMATQEHLMTNYYKLPVLWILPVGAAGCTAATYVYITRGEMKNAFISSATTIACLMAMCGAGIFPNLVPALNDPALSLTVSNASSSQLTLKVMLIIAAIGVPVVLLYTGWLYKTFSGKVSGEGEGY